MYFTSWTNIRRFDLYYVRYERQRNVLNSGLKVNPGGSRRSPFFTHVLGEKDWINRRQWADKIYHQHVRLRRPCEALQFNDFAALSVTPCQRVNCLIRLKYCGEIREVSCDAGEIKRGLIFSHWQVRNPNPWHLYQWEHVVAWLTPNAKTGREEDWWDNVH